MHLQRHPSIGACPDEIDLIKTRARPSMRSVLPGLSLKTRIGRLPLSEVDPIKIMMAFLFDRLRKLEFCLRALRQPDSALA